MSKLEEFKSIFNCKYCKQNLVEPVLLPCGESICKNHSETINNPFDNLCFFFHESHKKTINGFPLNKALKAMTEMGVNQINLNINELDKSKKDLEELKELIELVGSILENPKNIVYDCFANLKRQLDLRRDELKNRIDIRYEKIVNDVQTAENKCQVDENDEIYNAYRSAKKSMNNLVDGFDSFDISQSKYEKISNDTTQIITNLKNNLKNFEENLLGNKCHTFEFINEDERLDNLVGCYSFKCMKKSVVLSSKDSVLDSHINDDSLTSSENLTASSIWDSHINDDNSVSTKSRSVSSISKDQTIKLNIASTLSNNDNASHLFDNSKILNQKLATELIKLCNFENWKLIYRASRDGFEASKFHLKCYKSSKRMTIIKTTKNYIFGAVTYKAMNQSNDYPDNKNWLEDKNSFLFSLINSIQTTVKLDCIDPKHAIYIDRNLGPTFGDHKGSGYDICIRSVSNKHQNNHSCLTSYSLPASLKARGVKSDTFLAGSHKFSTQEIEVYEAV